MLRPVISITTRSTPTPRPPVGGIADYQIGGAYPPDPEVEIVTRDRSQDPVDGVYSICYVNAFQVQPDELAQWERDRPDLVLRGRDGGHVWGGLAGVILLGALAWWRAPETNVPIVPGGPRTGSLPLVRPEDARVTPREDG